MSDTKLDPDQQSQDQWRTILTNDLKVMISSINSQALEADDIMN